MTRILLFTPAWPNAPRNVVVKQLVPIIDTAVLMFVNITHQKAYDETVRTHRAVAEAIAEHDTIGGKNRNDDASDL